MRSAGAYTKEYRQPAVMLMRSYIGLYRTRGMTCLYDNIIMINCFGMCYMPIDHNNIIKYRVKELYHIN